MFDGAELATRKDEQERFERMTHDERESVSLIKPIPMARLGTADECVGAFVYFASERLSGYVTGQILEVNGGQYMP